MSLAGTIELLEQRDLREVVERICVDYRVTLADVLGRGRRGPIARARRAVYQSLTEAPHWLSYASIGRLLGRDPSTVLQTIQGPRKGGR